MTPKQKQEFLEALADWFAMDFEMYPGQWGGSIAAVGLWRDHPEQPPTALAVQPADGEPFLLRIEPLP